MSKTFHRFHSIKSSIEQPSVLALVTAGSSFRSSNGKEIADEDLQVASEEGSMSSAGGQREPPQPSRGNNSPRELVQELIDENTRLNEDNRRLAERCTLAGLPSCLLSEQVYTASSFELRAELAMQFSSQPFHI